MSEHNADNYLIIVAIVAFIVGLAVDSGYDYLLTNFVP